MTISTVFNKITYPANGSTTIWSFSFPAGPDPDIFVTITAADGSETFLPATAFQVNVNAPVDPNPTSIGGYVVYPLSGPPLALGNSITIIREVPTIQPTSFSNQSVIYPTVIEKAFDYVVMQIQQLLEFIGRTVRVPVGEDSITFPPCPQRANKFLAFDENCQPIATGLAVPVTSSNALRVPTAESIPELPAAPLRPGTIISFNNAGDPILIAQLPPSVQPLFGARVDLTGGHTASNSEKGFLFQLSGNQMYDFALGPPASYDADFSIAVFNADVYNGPGTGRAKRILLDGAIWSGGLLWPGQWVYIFRYGSTWVTNPRDIRWKVGVAPTFFVDPVLGHNDGSSDGLASGAGAFLTVAVAVLVANARVDYGSALGVTQATIQLAEGTYTEAIMINYSTVGGVPIIIKGADDTVEPTNYIINVAAGSVGVAVSINAAAEVHGITFNGTGNDAIGILAARGGQATVNNCKFGLFPGSNSFHMWARSNSTMNISNVFIVSQAAGCIYASRQSTLKLSGQMIVNPSLTFTAFAFAHYNSSIIGGPAAIGDATDFTLIGGSGCIGLKYVVQYNSVGNLGPGVFDTLPGSDPGSCGGSSPLHGVDASIVY
jgi:hypothetical protein